MGNLAFSCKTALAEKKGDLLLDFWWFLLVIAGLPVSLRGQQAGNASPDKAPVAVVRHSQIGGNTRRSFSAMKSPLTR